MTRSREEEEGAGEREDSRTVEEYDEEDGDSDLGNEIDNEDVVESILGEGGAVQWGALTGRRGGKTAGHSTPRADARQPLRTSRREPAHVQLQVRITVRVGGTRHHVLTAGETPRVCGPEMTRDRPRSAEIARD